MASLLMWYARVRAVLHVYFCIRLPGLLKERNIWFQALYRWFNKCHLNWEGKEIKRERERDRKRERERERQKERKRECVYACVCERGDRQTDTQTDKQTDRKADKQTDRRQKTVNELKEMHKLSFYMYLQHKCLNGESLEQPPVNFSTLITIFISVHVRKLQEHLKLGMSNSTTHEPVK